MNPCDEHIQPHLLAGNAFKGRLDLCVVRMTTGYSETADAMKLATPLNAEEATGDRRQDATLDKPRRNVSGVQQVIELEEKAKAQEDDELPYRKPVKPRGDCAYRDWKNCLRFQSICLLYMGRLCCHCLFSTRIPFSGKGTEHLMQRLSRCPDTNPG